MAKFEGPGSEKTYDDKPPHPHDAMLPVYRTWRQAGHETVYLPKDYSGGIDRFAELLEPRGRTEQLEAEYDKHGAPHWKDPYASRLAACLRKFLALSESERGYVVEQVGHGTAWRGDDMGFYRNVVRERAKFLSNPEKYINENTGKAAQAAGRMVV